jgi:replicative DNA helicase Mcm
MDMNEQIEAFKDFFDDTYKNELYTAVMGGKRSLSVDFGKLAKHNPDLAELLIQSPEDLIKASEMAIEHFDLPKPTKHFRIRYFNLPVSQGLKIADIRSEHLGMFIWFESIVRQSSDIRPQVTNAKFECAGCGNTISILQIDTKFKEPSRCTCGWRGKFRLLSKDLVDVQHLKVEEAPESLEGGEQPKRLSVFLQEDLVEAKMEKRTAPGAKILVFGIVKEIPIQLKTGAQSTRYDIVMEANNIVPVQEDFSDLVLNEKDIKEIVEFSKDPKIYEKFTKAVAPSIYGMTKQLLGGIFIFCWLEILARARVLYYLLFPRLLQRQDLFLEREALGPG